MTDRSAVLERQRPLRRLYAERPEAAISRKSARTSSVTVPPTDPFHGEVEVGEGYGTQVRCGADRAVGGLHDLPNPGDLLCAALAACEDVTIRMVADLLGVELERLEVEVSGDLDVRGALAVDPDVRVGFETLECRVLLQPAGEVDPRRLEQLRATAERFCVVMDTLRGGATVEVAAGSEALA